MTALTREPSFRRASTSGVLSSMRRPRGVTMRSMHDRTASSSVKRASARTQLALALDEDRLRVDHHDLRDGPLGEEALEGPEPQRLVGHLLHELLLVGARGELVGHLADDALEGVAHLRPHHVVGHLRPVEDGEVELSRSIRWMRRRSSTETCIVPEVLSAGPRGRACAGGAGHHGARAAVAVAVGRAGPWSGRAPAPWAGGLARDGREVGGAGRRAAGRRWRPGAPPG
jgi:hypothetical protein